MTTTGKTTRLGSEDARQAEKTGTLRWTLGVSLPLAVLALGVIALAFMA